MLRIWYSVILLCISITFGSAQKPTKQSPFTKSSHSRSAGTFLYTLTTTNETYTDLVNPISINNGEAWDEPDYEIPIGFPFEILEEPVDELQFTGSGSGMGAPTQTPYVFANIAPFEADLMDRGGYEDDDISISPISYVVEGAPGNRIFKLEFKNAGSYFEYQTYNTNDMFINFQMWLYEGSNIIQFRFGPSSIDEPDVFYDGTGGAFVGVLIYDEFDDVLSNIHLLTGNPSDPYLSSNEMPEPLNGTPPNGTVYTLSLDIPIDVNLLVSQTNSYCEPNSSIEAEATGGLPPYTYAWSNGETTAIINIVDTGTYTVTVTDQIGNSGTSAAMITTPDPMVLDINVTDETGDNADDGTAEVTATDGLAPYSYEWDNGETTLLIEDLAPGVYHVTVTDDAGCSETAEAVINPFGCPELQLEASIQDMLCFGVCEGVITIAEVVNGIEPITYEWDNGVSGDVNDLLCAGIFTVTVTDANLCVVSASYEVTSPTEVGANAFATNETLAGLNDGTATAASFGGTPPYNFTWSNGQFTQMITGLAPGMYSVIVTDVNNCVAFDTVVVEAGPCALLTATITDASCYGVCDGSIVVLLGGLPPAEITWTGGNGGSLDGESCAGEYIISASDGLGCTVVGTYTVGQPEELMAITGSTDETIEFEDGTAWVTPLGGTPPYTYLWSNGSTDSLITGLLANTYFVTLTDAHGCTVVDSAQVEAFACFHIIVDEAQDVFCHDSCDGLIFVTIQDGVGPFDYAWNTGDTSNIVFDLCAGWYSVTVTDLGQPGCGDDFIDVEITEPDSFNFTVDEIIHVTDSTEGSIQITVNGGTSPYFPVWFGPDLFLSFEDDITGLAPGFYILNLFDSNDCGLVDTIEVLDMTVGTSSISDGLVSVYPNPVTDDLYVDTDMRGEYEVSLFSAVGTVVGTWQNATRIDIAHLVPGLYVVTFRNAAGRYTEKVVIK
jgi:hypothetical protein